MSYKNLLHAAYLYAIHSGATRIIDVETTSASPACHTAVPQLDEMSTTVSVTLAGPSTVDPFRHFVRCNKSWQQTAGNDRCQPFKYAGGRHAVCVSVQQNLLGSFPFHAGINSRQHSNVNTNPLAVAMGSFAAFRPTGTLYYKSAFWALFKPSPWWGPNDSFTKSLWLQRLLWDTGCQVAFVTDGTLNNNATDATASTPEGSHASLVEYLLNWKCMFNNMFDCMLDVTSGMKTYGFLEPSVVAELNNWIGDMRLLGLVSPSMSPQTVWSRGHSTPPLAHPLSNTSTPLQKLRTQLYWASRYSCSFKSAVNLRGNLGPVPTLLDPSPFLSIIISIHNVDQLGNHYRLSHFLKMLADNTQRFQLHKVVELLIVDYNPNMDKETLYNAPTVSWPPLARLPLIRVLRIPPSVHADVLHNLQAPVKAHYFEFVGKNAAIRRACGEYVLTTNADTWLTPAFWDVIGRKQLADKFYYRAGRLDSNLELPQESLTW